MDVAGIRLLLGDEPSPQAVVHYGDDR